MKTASPLPLVRELSLTADEAKPDIHTGSIQSSSSSQTSDSTSALEDRSPDSSIHTAPSRVQIYNRAYSFEDYQSQLRVLVEQNRRKSKLSGVKIESVEGGRFLQSIGPTASHTVTTRDSAARGVVNSTRSLGSLERGDAPQQPEPEPEPEPEPLHHPLPEHQTSKKSPNIVSPPLEASRAHHITLEHPKSAHVRINLSKPALGRNSSIGFRVRIQKRRRRLRPQETRKCARDPEALAHTQTPMAIGSSGDRGGGGVEIVTKAIICDGLVFTTVTSSVLPTECDER